MIVAGFSAYSQILDFPRFREIADKVGAYLFVDMAHVAGLVAAGVYPNPVPFADVVTTTTHQDPARSTWRPDPGSRQRRHREEAQLRGIPGRPGWPAGARDRCQGDLLQGSAAA